MEPNFEYWRDSLPLHLSGYEAEMAAEVEEVILGVLAIVPDKIPLGERIFRKFAAEKQRLRLALRLKKTLPSSDVWAIGIAGLSRAGKDTAADYIESHYKGIERFACSDTIISEVNEYLSGFIYHDGPDTRWHVIDQHNKSEPHYRLLLQVWGMARRAEDPSYWRRPMQAHLIAAHEMGAKLILVTGVRDPVEHSAIRELGGRTWMIVRPGNVYKADHANERMLDDIPEDEVDIVINPSEGTVGPFASNIDAAFARKQ